MTMGHGEPLITVIKVTIAIYIIYIGTFSMGISEMIGGVIGWSMRIAPRDEPPGFFSQRGRYSGFFQIFFDQRVCILIFDGMIICLTHSYVRIGSDRQNYF